jgi:hypothetical protein
MRSIAKTMIAAITLSGVALAGCGGGVRLGCRLLVQGRQRRRDAVPRIRAIAGQLVQGQQRQLHPARQQREVRVQWHRGRASDELQSGRDVCRELHHLGFVQVDRRWHDVSVNYVIVWLVGLHARLAAFDR